MLDLQTIVEREAEPMGPVEERESTKYQQVHSSNRMPEQRAEFLVAWGFQPSQGKRESE